MATSKSKILILIDWFYPGYKAGGPIQSVLNLLVILKEKYDIYILTTDTDHGESQPYQNVVSNQWRFSDELHVHVFYAQKSNISRSQIKQQIIAINPDYVYLNHLYSPLFVVYPILLKVTNQIKCKVIISPRGALYESAIAVKAYKKRPLLLIYKLLGIHHKVLFHATNKREKEAIENYFPGAPIIVADNLPAFNQNEFGSTIKLSGELKCVFISRIVPIKNLLFVLEFLEQVKEKIFFTIAGPIEDSAYWDVCSEKINQLPSNISVTYIGAVSKSDIPKLIKNNHLFVLPTKGENFSHAIFESFTAGRPVLISDQTPWLHLADSNSGWDLPLDIPSAYSKIVQQMADFNQEQFDLYAKGAWQYANEFTKKSLLLNNYLKLFS